LVDQSHEKEREIATMVQQSPSLQSFESRLCDRLLKTQDASGGWAEHPGGPLSPFNTAEAVLALSVARCNNVGDVQQHIRRGVEFLLKARDSQRLPPPDSGAWYRKGGVHGHERLVPDVIRTSIVIGALINAGEPVDKPTVASAIEWLLNQQNAPNDDTGWAFQRSLKAEVLPTCFALLALIAASLSTEGKPWKDAIENGLKHLTEKLRNAKDGSFGSGILTAAHTIYACLVLQAARIGGFRINASAENEAIQWLLNNQDDALSPIEETIQIDPTDAANYPFMFTMEALLLRVLGNSQDGSHRETSLWLEVQRSVRANFDENTGGFYGQRVFSWSTANGLYAIKLSENNLKAIPPRPGEDPNGLKVGNAILPFVLVLVVVTTYLSVVGKFTVLLATFFWFLVVALLLAYGRIKDKTFRQLVSSGFGGTKRSE
jgi:hypothetical protein